MTREEAIKTLSDIDSARRNYSHEEYVALEMAIKVLEQEPCEDAISRQAVLDIVDSYSVSRSNVEDVTQDIISDIMALPTVTPKPKMWHWKDRYHDVFKYYCSKCETGSDLRTSYCPNCGAKMEESEDKECSE